MASCNQEEEEEEEGGDLSSAATRSSATWLGPTMVVFGGWMVTDGGDNVFLNDLHLLHTVVGENGIAKVCMRFHVSTRAAPLAAAPLAAAPY